MRAIRRLMKEIRREKIGSRRERVVGRDGLCFHRAAGDDEDAVYCCSLWLLTAIPILIRAVRRLQRFELLFVLFFR